MAATARSRSSLVPVFIWRVQSLQQLFDPPPTGYTSIHQERKLRCPFHARFAGDVALELDPVVLQRLLGPLGAGGVEDDGVAEVGLDLDAGDRDQLEAVVVAAD